MKVIFWASLLMMSINAMAQERGYEVSEDKKNGRTVFSGLVTFQDLENEQSFAWMKNGRNEYRTDKDAIRILSNKLKEYSLIVFLGTWCGDSHELIPKLEKVLMMAGYPQQLLTLYAVDRTKETKDGANKKFDITNVPTIIVMKDGKEKGRITETVQRSIEEDLVAIIEKEN